MFGNSWEACSLLCHGGGEQQNLASHVLKRVKGEVNHLRVSFQKFVWPAHKNNAKLPIHTQNLRYLGPYFGACLPEGLNRATSVAK